ncbi:MAG: FKBP-type peptidyl-prolyl cis-trans isomerase N-terminal domain-containing protein [Sphingomonadales bacterium]|jgi:FKBP-type peptidyl-prolyl cis-trans isomerase FklB
MKNTSKIAGIAAALLLAACGGKQVNPGKSLKTAADSFSYTVGYQVGKYMKGSGVDKIDYSSLIKGIEEALKKDSGYAVAEKDLQRVQTAYMTRERENKSKALKEAADKWMADNAKKPGVVKLASKGQYKLVEKGTGAVAGKNDTLTFHLRVKTEKGRLFFNTRDRQPAGISSSLTEMAMTPALMEAFEKLPAGSKFEVYTTMDASSPVSQYVKSFEEMYGIAVFEIEYLSVKPGKQDSGK